MTNNKQLLKLLEPYRDKTLSFGCEVYTNCGTGFYIKEENLPYHLVKENHPEYNDSLSYLLIDEIDVIGHPPTLNTVLIALEERKTIYTLESSLLRIFEDDFDDTPETIPIDLTLSPSQYSEEVSEKLVKLLTK